MAAYRDRRAYFAEYRKATRANINALAKRYQRRRQWRDRLKCLKHYGGDPPACACCGESNLGFLTLDHVDNDGHLQRPGGNNVGNVYIRLVQQGLPDKPRLQVLCWNCNMGREQNGGVCPHVRPQTFETRCKSHRKKASPQKQLFLD